MAVFDPYGDRSSLALAGLAALLVVATLATAGAFFADPADATPEPVRYDDAVELGLSAETDEQMNQSTTVPRVQVFYSQLQYVVGYNGVESFVDRLNDDRTESQFGYPLVAYVETFDGTEPDTTDSGLFRTAPGRAPAWTPADEAVYVVDGDARTSAGETVVPFASRDNAESFAADHGGVVVGWAEVRSRSFDVDSAATVRSIAPERWAEADRRIAAAERDADRPVSVVVGTDEPTIGDAIEAAPPDTTVVVPPGTYEETVTVNESITIAGDDARIRGDGNGSVVTVRASDVALSGLRIDGSGNRTRDPDAARVEPDADREAWDTNIRLGYGHGDAGVRAIDAPGLFVDDVAIETNASGVMLREGSDSTIRDLRVDGSEEWQDGFMGVTGMQSRVTVTDSSFSGGRDGIYLHRADESVVRNSSFEGNRYGTHLMYTGDALIADNVFRDELFAGVTVMTRPSGNAIVGNDVRGSSAGIQASGTRTYIGYNTLSDNELGFSTSSRGSLYERNVVADNELGARATTVVPSSRVIENDFVGNDDHAAAGAGALRVWADGDRGNYWEGANVGVHEPGERAYRPTSAVDSALHRQIAAVAVAESPAAALLDRLRGTVPGARSGSITDPSPAAEPYASDRVAALADADGADGDPMHADWRSDVERLDDDHLANTTNTNTTTITTMEHTTSETAEREAVERAADSSAEREPFARSADEGDTGQ
ncbi:NosD domain-containing protein [Halorubrum sp. AD140]|uniref:NosD domain-containing protein n=1 Tax=Halorubrum sp. AD140 TaxID=3050073 RepID=UPI002ACC9FA7|nr:NosD domain-containing protein [Halorubrum sp. AD140]MDZ5809790.1 NosD domain-containing protein [Halorubrum sp. AD140]